jgi:hypothetical protein
VGQGQRRTVFPVRIGRNIVSPAMSFKYLGVTISSDGKINTHQRAMFSKAKVSAFEVAKLLRRLEISDMSRLRSYMLVFVDSQFYGVELFPMHAAQSLDTARKLFMCTCFDLPSCTAKNLVYALFPCLPGIYTLLKRRATFYKRATEHELSCVRDAFLFDMCKLYPHHLSWTLQLIQMFKLLGIDLSHDIATFPGHLDTFVETVRDVEVVCFHFIHHSDEKTLSFFRSMPDVQTASSFRAFLSTCLPQKQNFLLLFLSSGFRWRFFVNPHRGATCPMCKKNFWSWEHFLSCPFVPVRTSVPEFFAMTSLHAWEEISAHVLRVVLIWLSLFDEDELLTKSADVTSFFM